MKKTLFSGLLFCCLCSFSILSGQVTDAKTRIESAQQKLDNVSESLFAGIKTVNIGPTVQSGRVVDLAVDPLNNHIFYIAYASGGLWKTINNGTSFEPLFDHEMVMTIGDFDVNWDTNEIWLGTGEVNSSRSSYSGIGMYYSPDGGKTWEHKGLEDTHHIGRVIIDPSDKNTIYVAALGHLYSPNAERGVFKTTDAGKLWTKVLFISENTGVVDLVMDPKNSNKLYAAAWQRSRKAWNFEESGLESGIYSTSDAGENWTKLNTQESGFVHSDGTGRIGIDITYQGDKAVLYALIDNYERREKEAETKQGLSKDDFKTMTKESFDNLSDEELGKYLKDNYFPKKYTTKFVRKQIEKAKVKVADLAYYLEDANSLLFDTPVKGAELYRSDDEGKTWKKTHEEYLDRVYNSYGYYFGMVKAGIENPEVVYIAGVPILRSEDGGKTFENINKENVHADHHALWVNPKNNKHIVNGNDGGVNISYDGGENWTKCNSAAVGQFYAINVDNAEPYNVYGGLQDNGVWMGSHTYESSVEWHQSGQYPYKSIMGGDGMQVQIDSRNNNIVYTGFQFGNYSRINMETEDYTYITPKHELGDRPYRWNWQSPILLSPHNPDIIYMGANKLLRSMNKGDDFEAISDDLTAGGKTGDVAFGTITSFSESPLKFGLIYTGSDDGMVYRTKNGGHSWDKIMNNLPESYWVSRIVASKFDENTVFLSLNGYRNDDFSSLIYISENQGDTWNRIGLNLPFEPINVILEDSENEGILYVGTDHGAYISTNKGISFELLSAEIPKVPVHDMIIQSREKDLLIATHGRSIYKIELEPIHAVHEKKLDFYSLDELKIKARQSWGTKNWLRKFNAVKEPIYLFSKDSGKLTISLYTADDKLIRQEIKDLKKGYNYFDENFTIDKSKEKILRKSLDSKDEILPREDGNIYLLAGTYSLKFEANGKSSITKLIVE